MSIIASIAAFLLGPLGRIALIGLALFAGVVFVDRRATYRERAKCDAGKLRAELAQVKSERDNALSRAALATGVIQSLQEKTSTDAGELARLNDELAKRPPQSTQPGAKHDPNALFDDRCRLTPSGARRLR